MKLVTCDFGMVPRPGLVGRDVICDILAAADELSLGRLPATVRGLLEGGPSVMATLRELEARTREVAEAVAEDRAPRPRWMIPEGDAQLHPPIPDPGKIICLGLNYLDHCKEQEGRLGRKVEPPPNPILFSKFANALTGPRDPIRLPAPSITEQVDYEVELAVVIGRRAQRVSAADALDCVAGYMVLNDVSARDCQFSDKQWVRAKSFDTFAPCGPALVTADAIPDPHALRLWTVLNGETMQNGSTSDFIFDIPAVIAFITQAITLEPGDIISTGTPAGVGVFRDPPVLLQPGDRVECGISEIGSLNNVCERQQ